MPTTTCASGCAAQLEGAWVEVAFPPCSSKSSVKLCLRDLNIAIKIDQDGVLRKPSLGRVDSNHMLAKRCSLDCTNARREHTTGNTSMVIMAILRELCWCFLLVLAASNWVIGMVILQHQGWPVASTSYIKISHSSVQDSRLSSSRSHKVVRLLQFREDHCAVASSPNPMMPVRNSVFVLARSPNNSLQHHKR